MIVVAIIGILAAVAIPAFMKYIHIRRLYESQITYYESEHTRSDGSILAKQFVRGTDSMPRTSGQDNLGY